MTAVYKDGDILTGPNLDASLDGKADLDPATGKLLSTLVPDATNLSITTAQTTANAAEALAASAIQVATMGQPGGPAGPLDAQGHIPAAQVMASGGGEVYSRPALSAFTPVNIDAASKIIDHANGPLTIYPTQFTTTESIRGLLLPCPAAPYTVTARFRVNSAMFNSNSFGILKGLTTSTRLSLFGSGYSTSAHVGVTNWTTAESSPGSYDNFGGETASTFAPRGNYWLQEYDDGTNVTYRLSLDGIDWTTLIVEPRAAWIAADMIGFGCRVNSYGGPNPVPAAGTIALCQWSLVAGIPAV